MPVKLANYRNQIVVADGGWTTQLRARGLPTSVPVAELANLTHPQLVETLAREYIEAGVAFLTTNTFAASAGVLKQRGVDADAAEVSRAGARLAKQAAKNSEVVIAGTIGPSGRILEIEEAHADKLTESFAEQARALQEGGVDVLLLETFAELAEIVLAIGAVTAAVGLPVIASMSFEHGPQHTRTQMGLEAAEAAEALQEAGAAIVGCNCGAGITTVLPAVVALRANTDLPLWVKPSAGLPDVVEGVAQYRQTPDEFDNKIPMLIDAGANIIGGCCGTGPEHIRRVAALVKSRQRKS